MTDAARRGPARQEVQRFADLALQRRGWLYWPPGPMVGQVFNFGQFIEDATVFAEAVLAACQPQPSLQSELLDLIKLMPDSQVDEILAFVATLREARQLSRGNAAASPPPAAEAPVALPKLEADRE